MKAALRSEFRKLFSTRIWWILLVGMVGYLGFIGVTFGFSITASSTTTDSGSPALGGAEAAKALYGFVSSIGYVFPLVIGSLMVTTEFRHKTITQTLLAEPRRGVFLAAKLLASVPVGILFGLAGTATIVAAGAPVLAISGDGAYLSDPDVLLVLLFDVVVTALWAVLGSSFGLLVTQQVAAIVLILAFTQFVEPVARVVLGSIDSLAGLASYLPGGAADSLVGASFFAELGTGDLLPRWGGALVFLGYIAVFATLGRLTTLRRDVG